MEENEEEKEYSYWKERDIGFRHRYSGNGKGMVTE